MPARNQRSQSYKIRLALSAPFPLDLLVRTPETMRWRVEEGDSFLREIVAKGKILYEKTDGRVGAKSGRGLLRRRQHPIAAAVAFIMRCASTVNRLSKNT